MRMCVWLSFPRCHLCCLLRQGFSLVWSSLSRLGWLTSKPQVSSCLCLLSSGIASTHHHIWVFPWVLGMELRASSLYGKCFTNSPLSALMNIFNEEGCDRMSYMSLNMGFFAFLNIIFHYHHQLTQRKINACLVCVTPPCHTQMHVVAHVCSAYVCVRAYTYVCGGPMLMTLHLTY